MTSPQERIAIAIGNFAHAMETNNAGSTKLRLETREDLHALFAELAAERDHLCDVLLRHGFRRCDIPACNCDSWHHVDGLAAWFREIDEAVSDHAGKTLLRAVQEIVAERDEAPDSTIDYETIREIAETEDALLDSMDYMEPFDVRELCRELMRMRRGKTMSEATVDYLFDKEARDR